MWRRRAIVGALALVALAPAPALAASPTSRAAAYLQRAQNADGGFGFAPGSATTPIATQWAAIGLRAAGHDPARVRRGHGATLRAAVVRSAGRARDASDTARAILALGSSTTLTRRLVGLQKDDGSFDRLVTTTAFGVLALRASDRSTRDAAVRRATAWLAGQQNTDGGWSAAGRGAASGIDETAAALQALVRGGTSRTAARVRRAVRFLRAHQSPDGGFPLRVGDASNAQSTAWAVQALVAGGVDPARVRHAGSRDPLAYLRSLQAADGAVRYSRTSAQTPVWVTAQALLALARRAF